LTLASLAVVGIFRRRMPPSGVTLEEITGTTRSNSNAGNDVSREEEASSSGSTSSSSAVIRCEVSRSISHLSCHPCEEENKGEPLIVRFDSKDDDATQSENEDSPYCRICFEGPSKDEPLFQPCDCKGSVAYVHHSCLSKWVSDSQRMTCELCQGNFRVPDGIQPFIPTAPILHKACQVAADSMQRSAALFNLLPQGSGGVTSNSAIIYLRGYGHNRSCSEFGLCKFGTTFPSTLEGTLTQQGWDSAVSRLNRVSRKMVNTSWRFIIFLSCLAVNVSLIIALSLVDHSVVIPFMFAVIMIQLLPAIAFAWISSHINTQVQTQLQTLCAELTEEFSSEGVTFGFHTITADLRSRNRLWNPYAVQPVGSEPKIIKFLTVERGSVTLEIV